MGLFWGIKEIIHVNNLALCLVFKSAHILAVVVYIKMLTDAFKMFFSSSSQMISQYHLLSTGKNKHFKVQLKETVYCIGQRKFSTCELVEHYKKGTNFYKWTRRKIISYQAFIMILLTDELLYSCNSSCNWRLKCQSVMLDWKLLFLTLYERWHNT